MATSTITTTAPHALRLAAAVGDARGLTVPGTSTPRSATAAEVNAWLFDQCVNLTLLYERKTAQQAVVDPTPIAPVVS